MREIQAAEITSAVRDLFIDANCNLGEDVLAAFDEAAQLVFDDEDAIIRASTNRHGGK